VLEDGGEQVGVVVLYGMDGEVAGFGGDGACGAGGGVVGVEVDGDGGKGRAVDGGELVGGGLPAGDGARIGEVADMRGDGNGAVGEG